MSAKPLRLLRALKPPNGETMVLPIHSVYAPASAGPFKCSNCEYFTAPSKCSQPEIVKLRGGVVEPEACCDFFEKD